MINCPVCGFRNPDINDRCFKCNAGLKHDQEAFEAGKAKAQSEAKKQKLEKFRDKLKTAREEEQGYKPYKYPLTAGLLSIFPGAGHLYLGKCRRGIIFFSAAVLAVLINLLTITSPVSNLILLGSLFYWVYIINDAVKLAAVNNNEVWSSRASFAVFSWLLFFIGISVLTLQFVFSPSVTFIRMETNLLAPHIFNKDLVVVNKMAYRNSSPEYDDIIMFDPDRLVSEQGENIVSVNITEYFQKVIGKEGDVIAKKGDAFYRNGQILPKNSLPFHGDKLPDFELKVERGKIFAPITAIPGDRLSGGGDLGFVGQGNTTFGNWRDISQISINVRNGSILSGKVLGILDPPQSRRRF